MTSEKTTLDNFMTALWERHPSSYSEKENSIFALFRNSLNFCRKFNLPLELSKEYLVDISVKTPTSIKMYKSLDNLLEITNDGEGKASVMRLSKFLIYTGRFTEIEIKKHVEVFNSLIGNFNYYELTIADPDGWVDVYENGINFTSCMVCNREDRYLDKRLSNHNHPVRAYCHPDNTIRLAYLANKQWQPGVVDFKVTARAIVNYAEDVKGNLSKSYCSTYGDEALQTMLQKAKFEVDCDMFLGQYLIKLPFNDTYIVPYLDGSNTALEEHHNKWVIADGGAHYANSSKGFVKLLKICPTCGYEHEEEETYGPNDEFCGNCVEDYMVYGYIGKYMQDYILIDSEHYEYKYNYYTTDALEAYGLVLIDGEVYLVDETELTSRGYVHNDDCVELDISFNDNNYAHTDDIIYVWDIEGNKLTVHEDMDLTNMILFASKEEYLLNSQIKETENE